MYLSRYLFFSYSHGQTPQGDLWKGSWLPITKLIREIDESFSGGGIKLTPLEPMRTWKVDFSGSLKNTKTQEKTEVYKIFNLLYSQFYSFFEIFSRCWVFEKKW